MKKSPQYNFHVSRQARDKYAIHDTLFSLKGRILFTNFNAVKLLTHSINSKRDVLKNPQSGASPGLLNAMGLIDEIFHFVISEYKKQVNENIFANFCTLLAEKINKKETDALLNEFNNNFPNNQIYRNEITAQEYLMLTTGGISNSEITSEEMLVTWLQNQNRAYSNLKDLIDDAPLKKLKSYNAYIKEAQGFFKKKPGLQNSKVSLLDMLLLPSQLFPESVFDQLKYMHDNWGDEIKQFISRILMSLDFIKEEHKHFDADHFSNPETVVANFADDVYSEPEAFSEDKDWMPHLVLIAKSTYVWLDQLSKQYKREINTLDKIPDEELNRLANFGFTGLWLIGLWDRSHASRKIKQINGNPEAVASAYSLKNYDIALDLGGFAAYSNLKERAWKRGIRLASDMVPNHMAIDSDWIRNHPHWFVHAEYPPFPNHTFNGPDLSDQDNMHIYLEDGYWNKSDAAVVFKRVDKYSGKTLYIYHGNDGTGMPWNDTAQLNYLLSDVREAVINTILHVAHLFPIIRFDAAMTLAKKHYQRLWFPVPGTGGDIPTRSEHALSREEFDKLFPVEFWREVVDRVAQECPDTLLLAEAFWMMEGYFVRTLGMHRVYNSAFMNMLKNEENDKYREMIKNVLEFNPQIMKRYVNFMNNPDEKTAVEQFGKEDKYFGVCILMCTMPGLPMFGHGQIEGFQEKYGMEYKKAYWDEIADEHMINRHRREVFPLLKKRKLFSEVENFYLFNFANEHGINENVYAYTNELSGEKALVLFNNSYSSAAGWIKHSVGFNDGSDNIKSKSLLEALHLRNEDNLYMIFSDSIRNVEYIRKNSQLAEEGFYAELPGYNYQVYFIREVKADNENYYGRLWENLAGASVSSIEESAYYIKIAPVIEALRGIFNKEIIHTISEAKKSRQKEITNLIKSIEAHVKKIYNFESLTEHTVKNPLFFKLAAWNAFVKDLKKFSFSIAALKVIAEINSGKSWKDYTKDNVVISLLENMLPGKEELVKSKFFDKWRIGNILIESDIVAQEEMRLGKILACYDVKILFEEKTEKVQLIQFFQRKDMVDYLSINLYQNIYYLNKEKWEDLLSNTFIYGLFNYLSGDKVTPAKIKTCVHKKLKRFVFLKSIARETGYDVDKLINAITQ